jgi:aminoglycoside phosphotransferase (APT) family kinase protein
VNWVELYRRAAGDGVSAAGYYHRNIPAIVDGVRVIVRIPIGHAEPMDLRIWPEPDVLRAIEGRVDRVPRVLHVSREPAFQVHEFIEGANLNDVAPRGTPVPGHVIGDVAALFAQLNAINALDLPRLPPDSPPDGDTADFALRVNADSRRIFAVQGTAHRELYDSLGVPVDPFAPLQERWGAMTPRPFALVHADVHRKNILIDGGRRCWFLDWELALFGDPVYDLAAHLHKTAYLPYEREALLRLWLEALPAAATAGYSADLDAYLAHEQIKSVLVDAVRYARVFAGAPAPYPRDVLVAKLAETLVAARERWGIDVPVDKFEIQAALRRHASTITFG